MNIGSNPGLSLLSATNNFASCIGSSRRFLGILYEQEMKLHQSHILCNAQPVYPNKIFWHWFKEQLKTPNIAYVSAVMRPRPVEQLCRSITQIT